MQSNDQLLVFRKFKSLDQANDLADLLKSNNIEVLLTDDVPPVDVTFTGDTLPYNYELRIPSADFTKANQILKTRYQELVKDADSSHYLFEFTDNELMEIVKKPDEWNEYDYYLAIRILGDRGKELDDLDVQELYHERIDELEKAESVDKFWIVLGYILAVLVSFAGMFVGWLFWKTRKTLPNGDRVFAYTEDDRKSGKIMFYIGLVIFVLSAITRLALEIDAYSN